MTSPVSKKPRLDDNAMLPNLVGIANNFALTSTLRPAEIIRVLIREPSSLEFNDTGHPWFTHQIFVDDKLGLDQCHFPVNSFVRLIVDPRSLSFDVEIILSEDVSEVQKAEVLCYFKRNMYPIALPKETNVETQFRVSTNASSFGIPSVVSQHLTPIGIERDVYYKIGPKCKNFSVHLTTYKQDGYISSNLLERLEKLAMWYIETASAVDFSEDKWEMLVMYDMTSTGANEESGAPIYNSIAGYMTLYTFNNPFLGSKIRICQALILPHYQKQGLGRLLLRSAYRLAQDRDFVVEVTVEDPCEAFQNLRDQVDFELYCAFCSGKNELISTVVTDSISFDKAVASIDSVSDLGNISKKLKVIPAQAAFVVEAGEFYRLLMIALNSPNEDSLDFKKILVNKVQSGQPISLINNNERIALEDALGIDQFKHFRLKVKRNIVRLDSQGLKDLPKQELQRHLSELFDERVDRYLRIWSTANRILDFSKLFGN